MEWTRNNRPKKILWLVFGLVVWAIYICCFRTRVWWTVLLPLYYSLGQNENRCNTVDVALVENYESFMSCNCSLRFIFSMFLLPVGFGFRLNSLQQEPHKTLMSSLFSFHLSPLNSFRLLHVIIIVGNNTRSNQERTKWTQRITEN